MNPVSLLWHLQTLDQEIADKTKRAHQVDDALAGDPAVVAAQSALDAEQKKLDALHRMMRDRELEAKGLDQKIKELNERVYSGRITNPKELDGYAKDLEMHKRNRSALDDKLLELMEAIDQAQKRVTEKANVLKQIQAKRAGDLEHLTHEQHALANRLSELDAEREKTRAALPTDLLRTYDQLYRTKAGRAVTQLKHNACGVCGMSVPTGLVNRLRTGEEIIFCSSCGRILAP